MNRLHHINGTRSFAWRIWRAFIIVSALVLGSALLDAGIVDASDNSDVEARIKAAFIYNFARFVDWPSRPHIGPVRIAILGHGDLASPLEEVIRGKSANGRPITVTRVNTPGEADSFDILLIERSESKHVKDIVQALTGKPILTVCDVKNSSRDGVMIAFQIVDETVRFQINQQAAEHAGLKISSQLLKVAIPGSGKHS